MAEVGSTGVTPERYLDPDVPAGLPWHDLPVVGVDDPRIDGLAEVVRGDPRAHVVPITPWPVAGRRPLDPGTGVGGGTTEGAFRCTWEGDRLMGVNEAVGGHYVLGYATAPEHARAERREPPRQLLLWHVNHHPDGGQLFTSVDGRPFLVLLAPPGPDPDLSKMVVVRSDGSTGICVLPGVWHDGVYPAHGDGTFHSRQGAVHARVSCDVAAELGCLLRIPLG